jgi:adenylyltransferase/sulfurtransferase
LGTTPAVIGAVESTEAIKHIVGLGEKLVGRLLIYNGEDMRFNEVSVERNPDCPVCGESGKTV